MCFSCLLFFKLIKPKHDTYRYISRKKQLKGLSEKIMKHRLDVQNIKNSPDGFNSMLKSTTCKNFAAKNKG